MEKNRRGGGLRARVIAMAANPSVDRVWRIPGFHTGGEFRVAGVWMGAGGKGCNVARVAVRLAPLIAAGVAVEVVATGFLAGTAGDFVERELERAGVRPRFLRLARGETRTCPTILDPEQGLVTEIREPGPTVEPGEAEAFQSGLDALLAEGEDVPSVLVLSGSLAPGLPEDFYGSLVRLAAVRGVPTVLDAGGAALRGGAEARPWAVKVNQAELMGLPGGEPADEAGLVGRLKALVAGGVALAAVTRGLRGLLAWDGRRLWRGLPPEGLKVVQPVGSGDAATAALALGLAGLLARGAPPPGVVPTGGRPAESLGLLGAAEVERFIRDMVAAGAANAAGEGVGETPPELFVEFRGRVRVEFEGAGRL